MSKLRIFVFIIFSVLLSPGSYSQNWDLRKDCDGIKVYTRNFEGSSVQEFRGEVNAKANMASILAVIDSIPEYTKWMYKCGYAVRTKRISWKSGYIYNTILSPWPISDRDLISYYILKQDSITKVITISLTGVKDYMPEKSGFVRVPAMTGFWQLVPVAKGITKIIYQVHCESGGSVPAAIVNAYITDTPYYNLLNLRKIVESPLFPKRMNGNIKEL